MPEPEAKTLSVFLLVAERGAGKTSYCLDILRRRKAAGLASGGVICPGVFSQSGEKTGCRALLPGQYQDGRGAAALDLLLRSNDFSALPLLGSNLERLEGPEWKYWSFSRKLFETANNRIIQSLGLDNELTFIDEIGPVELMMAEGFRTALDWILDRRGKILELQRLQLPVARDAAGTSALYQADESVKPILIAVRTDLADCVQRLIEEAPGDSPIPGF